MTALVLALALALQGAATARTGVVTGNLQMRDGSPAAAVRVAAIQAPPPNIRPSDGQNYFVSQPPVSVALTDNAGRYQLANVPPGRYYIVAGVTGQPTYYPAATDIDAAEVVTVDAGSPVALDFRLLTSPGSRVKGRITPPPATGARERAVLSGVGIGELLEAEVRDDGTFEFGRIPRGTYFVSLFPEPPGLGLLRVRVDDEDVSGLQFVRPPVRTVSGRIVVQNGPLPRAFLAFSTPQSYVGGTIHPDGTFTAQLHVARHRVDVGGLPVGYSLGSVRLGSDDVTSSGVAVGESDISGVVINVNAPRQLPGIKGRIEAANVSALSSARVQASGPIAGTLEAPIRADGSFEFTAVPPGLYQLRIPGIPQLMPMNVVVDWSGADVRLSVPGR